jgi:UMF1 family MFS transporter
MAPARDPAPRRGFLERVALHRPELRAWALYDWANSAMVTTIVAAVFPIYYSQVANAGVPPAEATRRYALCTTVALGAIALVAPVLGALADVAAAKKRLLAGFLALGAGSVAGMYWIESGDWRLASVLLVLANLGASGSFVFYDSLLPHVARDGEMDRVSTSGYALGYVGGGLLLAVQLAWIQHPGWFGLASGPDLSPSQQTLPSRLAFVSVAVWWLVFSIPLLVAVPEPRIGTSPGAAGFVPALAATADRLRETFRELRRYRDAFLMLVAFLLYNDGIQTIIKMATIYGTEIGIGRGALVGGILLVQFVGVPCTVLFGLLAGRLGTKPALYLALAAYVGIALLACLMRTAAHFYALAIAVGLVQGGAQALSRSLFASLVPRSRSSEFFGFFAVLEKFAGVFGPALFAAAIGLTGSSRGAVASVVVFFAAGALLLRRVDVGAGRRAARAGDGGTQAASAASRT